MKGLILSGGKGTRLRPITYSMAKQLVPVANKPVLFYGLEAMRDAGITEVGLVVGDTHEEIRQAVGDGSRWGLCVTYIQQDQPLGLAHAVATAQPFLGDSSFVMYLGDNLLKSGIRELVEEFNRERPASIILLTKVPNPSEFGVAELDGDRVIGLVEKPTEPKSDLALVGVYLFDSRVHESIAELKPSFRGELEITDAIQALIDRGLAVRSHIVGGWWKDTGTVEAILDANRLVLESMESSVAPSARVSGDCVVQGAVSIGEGTSLSGASICGPVVIGDRCRLEGVTAGPNTAIADGCELENAKVSNSILMAGCRIIGPVPPIVDSLIGSDVHVRGGHATVRLVLGDSSDVTLIP